MPDPTVAELEAMDPDDWPEHVGALVECEVCRETVALVNDDPENWPGLYSGDCCDRSYVDWWDGSIVIRPPASDPPPFTTSRDPETDTLGPDPSPRNDRAGL